MGFYPQTKNMFLKNKVEPLVEVGGAARSTFRVTYYASTGRGEPLRLVAALGGVAFEDRFIAQADFKGKKERGEMRW